MPRFSAHLGYLFNERPLIDRIDAAAADLDESRHFARVVDPVHL